MFAVSSVSQMIIPGSKINVKIWKGNLIAQSGPLVFGQ